MVIVTLPHGSRRKNGLIHEAIRLLFDTLNLITDSVIQQTELATFTNQALMISIYSQPRLF